MKKLLAISILCSSSALIGFSVAGVMLSVSESATAQRAYEVMKSCNYLNEFDKDNQVEGRLMMLEAIDSDDQAVKDLFKTTVSASLLKDAVRLRKEIDSDLSDSDVANKKRLLNEIENKFSIKAS